MFLFQHGETLLLSINLKSFLTCSNNGGFGGGGGGRPPPPSGIRPPADPKGPPSDTFSEIHFWPTDPKIFLKAPWAPIYTNFEEERAPKKKQFFLSKFFKIGAKQCFGSARKINLVDLKKKGRQNFRIFLKIRLPPLEKILDPPLFFIYLLDLSSDYLRYPTFPGRKTELQNFSSRRSIKS